MTYKNAVIRKGTAADFEEIMGIYRHAQKFMKEHGNPRQWGDSYPAPELVQEDLKTGQNFVCEAEGRILATFVYRYPESDANYDAIRGKWLNEEPYGVIHRIASAEGSRGAATLCVNWVYEQCGNIRIDTHADNTVMQRFLTKNGFVRCGEITLADGTDRTAFHKPGQE